MLTVIIQSSSIPYLYSAEDFLFVDDYYFDAISILLNLLFICRFQIYIKFPLYVEIFLLISQNLGCYYLLFNEVSLVNEDTTIGLKICLIAQILLPYVLITINLLDVIGKRLWNIQEEDVPCKIAEDISEKDIFLETDFAPRHISEPSNEKGGAHMFTKEPSMFVSTLHTLSNTISTFSSKFRTSTNKPQSPLSHFIVDCNNNFLPIFMSHSFLLVNDNFPFYSDSTYFSPSLIYKLAQFSLKIYCIYQFILYEVASIIYGIEDVRDYSIFYVFDSYNTKKLALSHPFRNMILVCTCMLVLMVDAAYIYMCSY